MTAMMSYSCMHIFVLYYVDLDKLFFFFPSMFVAVPLSVCSNLGADSISK